MGEQVRLRWNLVAGVEMLLLLLLLGLRVARILLLAVGRGVQLRLLLERRGGRRL